MVAGEEIIAKFTNQSVPLVAPGVLPTIRIRRSDTGALVVTDDPMIEIGDGLYRYNITGLDPQLDYSVRADGDPTAAGQVTLAERYAWGVIAGIGDDYVRKVLTNRAETTDIGGAKQIDFYDDDAATIIDSITISADGLTRTNP